MRNLPRRTLLCVVCFLSASAVAAAQSVPVETGSPLYTGFQMPTVGGSLHYALNAGERVTFGYNQTQGTVSAATFSGNLGYITPSIRFPTTINYTGGYLQTTYGQPSAFFQDATISQAYQSRKWHLTLSDAVSYLPETSASGIYGVIGTGTNTGITTPQGVLVPYATRVENSVTGDAVREITGKTSLNGIGFYSIERFPGYSGGIQTNIYSLRGGVDHRLNTLSSFAVNYAYSNFSYLGVNGTFQTQGVQAQYKRQLTRSFSFAAAAGPQRTGASALTLRPASYSYTVDAQATYVGDVASAFAMNVSFIRSTNGGAGITFGAINNTVTGNITRRITRSTQATALGSYSTSTGLLLLTATQVDTKAAIGSVQVNRAFTRTLSAFVSYTAQHQSVQGLYIGVTPLIGLQQILGFGVTYSPSPIHLGR